MANRKRILYIQTSAGGGALIALYEMVRALDKRRFAPYILCYEQNAFTNTLTRLDATVLFLSEKKVSPSTAVSNTPSPSRQRMMVKLVARIKKLLVDDKKMARRIEAVIRTHQIDLLHHNIDFPSARQGVLANLKMNLPQVCHYRSLKHYQRFSFDWFVDRYLAGKIDQHIYISYSVRDTFEKYLGNAPAKGLVVRDIIDADRFQPSPPDENLVREFSLQSRWPVVSCIGRIVHWKGHHVFIEAFAKVAEVYPTALGLLVGPYEQGVGDRSYFDELKQMVSSLGLQDKIIFTGNREDIPAIMSVSDCIVHSSVTPEPQGLIIVEALFNKKPVIVTDAGGAAELIVNNEGGLKVQPGNAAEMAHAIVQVISDKSVFIKAEMPAILKTDFNEQIQIGQIEGVYDRLLGIGAHHNN